MQCPLCTNETLQPHYRGGIEIDICPRCKGIWLDRGELDRLVTVDTPAAPAPWSQQSVPQPIDGSPTAEPARDRLSRPASDAAVDRRRTNRERDGHEGGRRDADHRDTDRKHEPNPGKKAKKKKSRSKRLADALEDLFDDVLDL